jgi:predicted nucleotide-binding protein
MHCCDFGIGVFERILEDNFNPNVSIEVGYMMGLRKKVCLLKDQTLNNLPTDLMGKLYKPFDPQNIEKTLPDQLEKWMQDKGLI